MRVLVAIDGSQCSIDAVDHCLSSAWPDGTQFNVVTAIDFFEALPALTGQKKREIQRAEELVKEQAARLSEAFPDFEVSQNVLDGYTKSQILDCCCSWGADLIVMGSHGRKGFEKLLLGSVSQSILEHAPCAVRIVRSEKVNGSQNVLICLDGSKYSESALEQVLSYDWPSKANFSLVSVTFPLPDSPDIPSSAKSELESRKKKKHRQAESILESAERKLKTRFESCKVELHVEEGDPRQKILELADSKSPSLIVLGSHGRAILDKLLIGSVSEAVATHANCSVEVVRTEHNGGRR